MTQAIGDLQERWDEARDDVAATTRAATCALASAEAATHAAEVAMNVSDLANHAAERALERADALLRESDDNG